VIEAADFKDECDALAALLQPLREADWSRPTLFKGWTINDIMVHLTSGNLSADLSLNDPAGYNRMKEERERVSAAGNLSILDLQHRQVNAKGGALLAKWREQYPRLTDAFSRADPRQRVPWASLDMSARSSISARLMETWAHAQAIYDLLGKDRVNTDRIHHVAILGVNTYGWTFANRKLPEPGPRPAVRLTAPSGATWEWPAKGETTDSISGSAAEFCQVVTQTRNIGDTGLWVSGPVAKQWMAIAQCFAGPPRDPPAPGARYKAKIG
jgi:uncharacterized protein (TIGR03084 family)